MMSELAQALQGVAVLGAIVRLLLVATLVVGLWYAMADAGLAVRARLRPWGIVAVVLILWLATAWTLASQGVSDPVPGAQTAMASRMIVAPTLVFVAAALTILMRSKTIASAIDAAPLWWLVAYQGYRVAGVIFLRLWAQGFLPDFFALPAGIGDMLTGALATCAAIALARDLPWAPRFAYAVNIFGIVDLVNAVTLGVVSTTIAGSGASPLLMYPLAMVPTFGVPLAFIIHSLSLWQLHRRSRLAPHVERALHSTVRS
jgi:hypothetical protein